jgi:hypothetical protein
VLAFQIFVEKMTSGEPAHLSLSTTAGMPQRHLYRPLEGQRVNPQSLETGQWVSRVSYMKVVNLPIPRTSNIRVENKMGKSWTIAPEILNWECYGADYFTETFEVTRTDLAHILHNAHEHVFKVRFTKKTGEERVMVGHLVEGEELMGRAQVYDLEVPANQHALRQVDYRTLEEIIYKGVRYVLKGKKH